ncbi:hypothetical protein AMTRI_Chr01g102920 [Amborella trichopoda]
MFYFLIFFSYPSVKHITRDNFSPSQVPLIADALDCSEVIPKSPSFHCEQPHCIDTCVRIYGQRASAMCIPRSC